MTKWYVHCGCPDHGDHGGCRAGCADFGCAHPLGAEIAARTADAADARRGLTICGAHCPQKPEMVCTRPAGHRKARLGGRAHDHANDLEDLAWNDDPQRSPRTGRVMTADDTYSVPARWVAHHEWVVIRVEKCTCGGESGWPHESHCGLEPIVRTRGPEYAEIIAREYNRLIDEIERLSAEGPGYPQRGATEPDRP